MHVRHWYLILLLFCGWGVACESDPKENTPKDGEILPDSVDMDGMVDAACLSDKQLICNQGLYFAPLGKLIADTEGQDLEALSVDDSLDYEMGYVRLNRSFSFEDGVILLEGDAITEAEATDELLSASKISRIRVEVASFRTEDGVHAGMDMSALTQLYQDTEMSILSFGSIPEFAKNSRYEFMVLNPEKFPNITYLVPDPGFGLYEKFGDQEILLSELPEDIQISGIVVSM